MKAHPSTPPDNPLRYSTDEACAAQLDATDPLAGFRKQFHIPNRPDGTPVIYFAGNSLGLMPKRVQAAMDQELEDWANRGVDGHFEAKNPWYTYHETLREPLARLIGAIPSEVVLMNTLTVNLHLMMVTF